MKDKKNRKTEMGQPIHGRHMRSPDDMTRHTSKREELTGGYPIVKKKSRGYPSNCF